MSVSVIRTQGTQTIPNVETAAVPIIYGRSNDSNRLNTFNHDLQAWGSRSVSPLSDIQTPNGSESQRQISDPVIRVTDDGWRTVTQGSPLGPHIDVTRPNPTSVTYATTAGANLHPPPCSSVHPETNFQYIQPSSGEVTLCPPCPPTCPLSRPQEFYQLPPLPYFGMPLENKFQGVMHVLPQSQAMPFPAPGYYPFTDHSFCFEHPRNHLIPPQFPMPPNLPSPRSFIFSNPVPIPGILDSRIMPFVSYDYASSRPPQHYFSFPSQTHFSPPTGPPVSPVHQANDMGNNFVTEACRELPFENDYSTGLSPPYPRHGRNPQRRQPRSSSSSSPQGGNRNGRRVNQTGLALSARSSLMEEFRNFNKDKQWCLKDIFGHIVEFSTDQNGSRLIQQQLEEASEDDRQRVFDEIVPSNTSQLIQDVFGNYVVQRFFDLGTASQKDIISLEVENNVINYSVHIYACRVVQKAFDYMSEEQQDRVIDRLAGNLLTCIKDQHGNHVIQKLIDTVPAERLTFLRIISVNILDLAASSTGCRVLQRCLSKLPKPRIQPVLDAIDRHCDGLMRDQYGNYVVQFILQQGDDDDKARVLAKIRGSVVKLAKNQYASHVCEKAITHSDGQNRSLLIDEILTNTEDGHPIPSMIRDDFANYVLQRALVMAEGEQRVVLFHQVKSFLMPLGRRSSNTYSKQLVKVERLVDRYFGKMDKTVSENSQGIE